MSTDHIRRRFANLAVDDEGWFFIAEDLMFAAGILEPQIEKYWNIERELSRARETEPFLVTFYQPDPRSIYLMLMAYAIENLYKGLLVLKEKKRVWAAAEREGKGERLTDVLGGHKLLALLSRIGFHLTTADKELAVRLRRCSEWSARYPVPPRFDHDTLTLKTATGEEVVPPWYREDDVQVVKEFVSRIDSFIGAQLPTERGR
jgi:hypothetical protein